MRCGRSAPELILSAAERSALERLIAGAEVSRAVKQRSRAILPCAQGKTNVAAAHEAGLTNLTVGNLRRRFLASRMRGVEQDGRGRPVSLLVLNQDERRILEGWSRSSKVSSALARGAKVILACAEGKNNKTVARDTRQSEQAVGKARGRFVLRRLEGLTPRPLGRPVAPLLLSPDEKMTLEVWSRSSQSSLAEARRIRVILACAERKSNKIVAKEVGVSAATVSKVRRRFFAQRLNGLNAERHRRSCETKSHELVGRTPICCAPRKLLFEGTMMTGNEAWSVEWTGPESRRISVGQCRSC